MSTPPEQEAGVDPLDAALVPIDPDNPAVYGHGEDVPGYAFRYLDPITGLWTIRTPYTVCFFEKLATEIKQKIINESTPIIETERLPIREYHNDFRVRTKFESFETTLGQSLKNLQEIMDWYATLEQRREFSYWRRGVNSRIFGVSPPRDFYELRQRWNNQKVLVYDFQNHIKSNHNDPFVSEDIEELFKEELTQIDDSLKKLHQALQKSVTEDPSIFFYEHQQEWQTKKRLWMILGNRVEKKAACDRIMLSRNPPPSPSPEPESPDRRSRPSRSRSPGHYDAERTWSYTSS